MAPIAYSGSLSSKRKDELLEIAQALNLPNADEKTKRLDLVDSIHAHMDQNEKDLQGNAQFKGLYVRRRHHSDDESAPGSAPVSTAVATALAETKTAVGTVARQSRKSANKLVEKAFDAANVPLPESPLADKIATIANDGLEVALAPAQHLPKDMQLQLRSASSAVVPYIKRGPERVERVVRIMQRQLSKPESLITTALGLELLFLLSQTLQFYEHTFFFPPVGGTKGDVYSLLHSMFGWAPVSALTIKLPEITSFFRGQMWSALTWWLFATVLPPLALSTLVSFVPQTALAKHSHNTRSHSAHGSSHGSQLPHPTPDPLAFSLFRLAALVLPLTTAAPASLVDALELSGNAQGRALGAALVATLTAADRLRA